MRLAFCAPLLLLAACAHPEDRRWAELSAPLPTDAYWQPRLNIYSVATPSDPKAPMRVKDLAGEGQAAYIDKLSTAKDPKTLRLALAAPIGPSGGIDPSATPTLDRTVIISVQKPITAGLADRIMKTVITIRPVDGQFEFAGYSIVATDNQVQNIAHLETTTEASLDASLSPTIKGTGDNSIDAKISKSQTSAADIAAQYEKLGVDIQPDRIVITRESERGLDVVGNTIIKLTLVPKLPRSPETGIPGLPAGGGGLFLVDDQSLISNGTTLPAGKASIDIEDYLIPQQCDLRADVSMTYLVRRVTAGTEYYTEGKQTAQVDRGALLPEPKVLVRGEETVPLLWQIVVGPQRDGLIARRPGIGGRILVFNNYNAAQTFAYWLGKTGATGIGSDGILLSAGAIRLKAARIDVAPYVNRCRPS
jgi:hypothetical protein